MNKNVISLSMCCIYLFTLAGCCKKDGTPCNTAKDTKSDVMLKAEYSAAPVKVDGKLDDAVWQKAAVYQMNLSADEVKAGNRLQEGGQVQFAWDEENFYLAATFEDSDIFAEGDKDQLHHYQLGDICELFLKSGDRIFYFELYATPRGKKTTFWFPGGSVESLEDYKSNLTVAAQNDGTLNDRTDKDTKWTAEMAMPVKDLCERGETFGPGSNWRAFVGRYNYSNYLKSGETELSMAPQLSATNYHLINEYGHVDFVGATDTAE